MLRVEKLTYEVKGRKLLKDISFQLRKGEVLALLGANGVGKSTLMGLLSGDKKPQSGTISLNGQLIASYDPQELSKCRAMLSQQQQISLAFKVREIVMMGRYPHFRSNPAVRDTEVVEEVMQLCGVSDFADRIFLSLSGGEQQRVQLARILAQIWDNPNSLLLLDEPISALDLHYQQKVLAIAKALSRRGLMVVLVVHDVNFAAMYADRILMLKHGRKLFDGSPMEVLNTKDIYTVFSVETTVELNAKTLKPYVRLEEMDMDVHLFNSMLPVSEKELSLERRRALLLGKSPYLSVEEQSLKLGISEAEAMLLDKENTYHYIRNDFARLLPYFSLLGSVKACTKNGSCKHTKIGVYAYAKGYGDTHLFAGTRIDLRLFINKWHVGILVDGTSGRSLHFFDREGCELHAIQLIDGESDLEGFDTLKKNFCEESEEAPRFERQLPTDERATLDELQQEDFRQEWEALTDTHAFQSLLHKYGLSRLQALAYASVCRAQRRDATFVRKTLHTCAAQRLPIMVFVYNQGCVQIHTGPVTNLIDQGDRYMIKDSDFSLEIRWERIGEIWTVSKPTREGDVHSIELFDIEGHLVMQLFGERKPEVPELETWRDLVNMNDVVI